MIQQTLAIWSLVPLPFLNSTWTSGSSQFMYCWSLAWRILSITLLVCEISAIVQKFEHCLTLPFFGIPWWLRGKASACNAGDLGLIPVSGRSPGEGNGNPLQYSCLENPMGYNPWGCKELDTTDLSLFFGIGMKTDLYHTTKVFHKLSCFKQHTLIIPQFLWIRSPDTV